jgi:release factor glutamine methyltransferase
VLARAGIESPRVEAEALLAAVLSGPRYAAYLEPLAALTDAEREGFGAAVRRRARREPIQYVIGRETFCGLDVVVTPDVLIPRPETEGAVAAVLAAIEGVSRPVIADVGTGSGCLALAIAAARPDAIVHAVDRSGAALGVARANAERLGLAARVRFVEGDLVAPLAHAGVRVDAVVSNPPYVADDEYEALQPEVRFEPESALRGGPDGLAYYRRIVSEVPVVLASRGRVVLEVGFGQAEAVRVMAERAEFGVERLEEDFNGIPRIMTLVGPAWT